MKQLLLLLFLIPSVRAQEQCSFNAPVDGNMRFGTPARRVPQQGFVENYGSGLERIQSGAATLYWGSCKNEMNSGLPSAEEVFAVNCSGIQGNGYHNESLRSLSDFSARTQDYLDNQEEELLFQTATDNIHRLATCQSGLFSRYFNPEEPQHRSRMLDQAFNSFERVRPLITTKLRARAQDESTVALAGSFRSCIKDSCQFPDADESAALRTDGEARRRIADSEREIDALLATIPMANRESMKTGLKGFSRLNPQATREQFVDFFDKQMLRLRADVTATLATLAPLRLVDARGHRHYCVDTNLKRQLYRSGQMEIVLQKLAIPEQTEALSCRMGKRYGMAGEVISELALVPTYFLGYGFARLALRAGIAGASARGARAVEFATRLGMLGFEGADLTLLANSSVQACLSSDFMVGLQGKDCTPEGEFAQAMHEADVAGCISNVLFFGVSDAAVVLARKLNSPAVSADVIDASEEIVVTAPRRKLLPLTPIQANRLSERQRIDIVEEHLDGIVLDRDAIRDVLRLVNSSDAKKTHAELSRIFLSANVEPGDVDRKVTDVVNTGVLGNRRGNDATFLSAVNADKDWRLSLDDRNWKRSEVSLVVQPKWSSLPDTLQEKFKTLRRFNRESRFSIPVLKNFNYKNRATHISDVRLTELLTPSMRAPHERALELLSDNGRWANYFEDTMGEVFRRMLTSGNERLVSAANRGEFSQAVLIELFRERFAKRDLVISEIPIDPTRSKPTLTYREFSQKLKAGPIWDRALEGDQLPMHGPFPHLFQLDYVIDEMVRVGKTKRAQDFFDYWGGSDEGLGVWNDVFDLYNDRKFGINTLRDTTVITTEYLAPFKRTD